MIGIYFATPPIKLLIDQADGYSRTPLVAPNATLPLLVDGDKYEDSQLRPPSVASSSFQDSAALADLEIRNT
jgi:hypothetical protein